MKLTQIEIENFRGFKKLSVSDFKDINLVVGKNNAGKTSLLESLFLSIGMSNPQLALNVDAFRGLIHDESEDFRFIFHNLDYHNPIRIRADFDNGHQVRHLQINPLFADTTTISIGDLDKENVASNITPEEAVISGVEFSFSIHNVEDIAPKNYKSSIKIEHGQIVINKPKDYKEGLLGVFQRPISSGLDLYQRLDKILIKKGQDRFIESLKVIDKRIQSISLGAKNMIYFDIGIERLVPIQIMGDGIIRHLAIMAAIASNENGFVIIDEIENGFHYSVLGNIWKTVDELSKLYNVQIFATTHSYECVKAFSFQQGDQLIKDDKFRAFRIQKGDDEKYSLAKYDLEQLKSSIDNDWEIR